MPFPNERKDENMTFKGVLFDFNGTMFFDSHYHDIAWKKISMELRGSEMSDDELAHHMHGKNNERIIDYLTDGKLTKEENAKWSLKKEAMYRKMCLAQPETFHLAPGVEDFLHRLCEKKIPFTIASASIKENIDFFVEQFHLTTWLNPDLIVYDDGTYPDKVTMFQEAAHRIHVDIKDCLVFEDSISGIKFAHEAQAGGIIAIQQKDTGQYKQFPYILDVYPDFTKIPLSLFE